MHNPCKHPSSRVIALRGHTLTICKTCGSTINFPTLRTSFVTCHDSIPAYLKKSLEIRHIQREMRGPKCQLQ
jgi:hypothetical protein